ncbi:hypothetical protein [Empedobacter sp. UBA7248]|uniref:hypothetical protein n=1 Tax=Empedobacter sp. UBA7248 TaxID=1946448 RepID=UPI0025BBA5EB|nr:hypothetical protein [Empedobacter sp. UBA7248]
MENKKASVEIGVNLSSSLMNASLTMLTIIMALYVFIIEKREVNTFFYIFFFLGFLSFIISIFQSGKGIDKARKALFSNNFSRHKTRKHYNYQAISCFLGILFSLVSIFCTSEDNSEKKGLEKLNKNFETYIKLNNSYLQNLEKNKNSNEKIESKLLELENKIEELSKTKQNIPK